MADSTGGNALRAQIHVYLADTARRAGRYRRDPRHRLPGITNLALVIPFAVYAFTDARLHAMKAFSSRAAGPVFGHLLLGRTAGTPDALTRLGGGDGRRW